MAYIAKKLLYKRLVSFHSLNRTNSTRRFASATLQTSVACLLRQKPDSSEPGKLQADNEVILNGYIHSIRNQKTRSFAAIGDGSCLQSLQALLTPAQAKGLSFGTAVTVKGLWKKSLNPAGQTHELHVSKLDVVAATDSKFPLQKKYQTPEYLRTIPHLRMRTPFNTTLLRLRSDVIAVITKRLSEMSFIQTHTPIITSSDCEGAGEVFQIGLASKQKSSSSGQEFFRSPKYLTVSSQLHLEALAQAVGKVWTLSPTFRAEKSDTSRHLSEFYMLEAEINFADSVNDVMKLIQEILLPVVQNLYSSQIGDEILSRGPLGEKEIMRRWDGVSNPWKCITYTDAIKTLKSCTHIFEHEPKWGLNLQAEHERYLTNEIGVNSDRTSPLFITHFPRTIKPFYMLPSELNDGLETVECFDVLVPDLGEMAGGSMREHRLEPLIKSMFMNGLIPSISPSDQDLRDLKWYIDLRKWGCVPHGGFGLGFDRLLGFIAGVANIREIVTFPRWVGRCDC